MSNFYKDVLLKLKGNNDPTHVYKDLALLEPGTRHAVEGLLADAKLQGFDLRLGETYRTQARQSMLFKRKATKLKKVGCHGYGLAADLQLFIKGKYWGKTSEPYFLILPLARKWGLISGLDWDDNPKTPNRFMDGGHVQRIPVWRQNDVFSGKWYVPERYDPRKDIQK